VRRTPRQRRTDEDGVRAHSGQCVQAVQALGDVPAVRVGHGGRLVEQAAQTPSVG
jgi:hypothetical protein